MAQNDNTMNEAPQASTIRQKCRDAGVRSTEKDVERLIDGHGNSFRVPDYSMKQLRDAIPAHCFDKSALTGMRYVLQDLSYLAVTFYIFYTYVTPENVPSFFPRFVLWSLYTVLQGIFGIGVWVLAHECNHGAFSNYPMLNDVVGWTLHSFLLVPYFSWKLTHRQHHALHNNLAKDMQFVPKSKAVFGEASLQSGHLDWDLVEDSPLWTAVQLIAQQLLGWPRYLMTNDSGSTGYRTRLDGRGINKSNFLGGGVSHFDPESPLFSADEAYMIWMSDLGLAITLFVTTYLGYTFGWVNILTWYWVPYLWVNHWLVAIAYLHHTDPSLPKYMPGAWNYVRGAAATMDRDFGFIGHYFFHDIIETHVLHHTFPSIPFYHAQEATEAIKTVMREHYRSKKEEGSIGFLKSLWYSARSCQWVEPCGDVSGPAQDIWFYRNKNGIGVSSSRKASESAQITDDRMPSVRPLRHELRD